MRSRGFTLVETMLVIGICSILLALALINYRYYDRRYRIERQTRLMQSELRNAQFSALTQKRVVPVRFYPRRFEVYSSEWDGALTKPSVSLNLTFPIRWGSGPPDGPEDFFGLEFDDRGVASKVRSICVDDVALDTYDSVVISKTRVAIGSRKETSTGCLSDQITLK